MKYSQLFGKTTKTVSGQFESKSHELLTKAGFISQLASGIFNLLPLGKIVLSKIEQIIREEMNALGAQEIQMPILHPKSLWQQSGRWESVDVLFKTQSRFGQEYAFAPTHEETITPLVKKFVKSYRDLPIALYHITQKFRDEPRPKSGILRGREFGMKDLYSFHATKEDLQKFYQAVIDAYLKIFKRCGLDHVKITEASGGSFTKKFSHEFNIITPAGEVDLLYCPQCSFAQNKEIATLKINDRCPKCQENLKEDRAIEVGNIFDLGIKFSQAFDLKFSDPQGKENFILMGCYGIGTSRLIGAIAEIFHDDKGLVWPKNVAPYHIHLIGLNLEETTVNEKVHQVYQLLQENNISVLFDDREKISAGEKFADADLIGLPLRVVISKKTADKMEVKKRNDTKSKLVAFQELQKMI
mgnify:CR=1 FL=1